MFGHAVGLATSAMGFGGGLYATETQRGMTNKQMRFQKYMSNTAHQRQVTDLNKAGLNPLLAMQSGASSPHRS